MSETQPSPTAQMIAPPPPSDPLTRDLLAIPGSQVVWTGGNCSTLLIPTKHYVFSLAGEDLHSVPTLHDTFISACVYPRFGRADPERIFVDAAYPVPEIRLAMPMTAAGIQEQLSAYRMSDADLLSVIRSVGAWQSSEQQREGAISAEAIQFRHDDTVVIDPFSDESGMTEVHPLAYYGDSFRHSAFWAWRSES